MESAQSSLQRIVEGWKTQRPRNAPEMQQRIEEVEKLYEMQISAAELPFNTAMYIFAKVFTSLDLVNPILGKEKTAEFRQTLDHIKSSVEFSAIEIHLQHGMISDAKKTNNIVEAINLTERLSERLINFEKNRKILQHLADARFQSILTKLEETHMNYLRRTYSDLLRDVDPNADHLSDTLLSSIAPLYLIQNLFDPNSADHFKAIKRFPEPAVIFNNILTLISAQNGRSCKENFILITRLMKNPEHPRGAEENVEFVAAWLNSSSEPTRDTEENVESVVVHEEVQEPSQNEFLVAIQVQIAEMEEAHKDQEKIVLLSYKEIMDITWKIGEEYSNIIYNILGQKAYAEFDEGIKNIRVGVDNCMKRLNEGFNLQREIIDKAKNILTEEVTEETYNRIIHHRERFNKNAMLFDKEHTEMKELANILFRRARIALEKAHMKYLWEKHPDLLNTDGSLNTDVLLNNSIISHREGIILSSELVQIYLCRSLFNPDDISSLLERHPSLPNNLLFNNLLILTAAFRTGNSCSDCFDSVLKDEFLLSQNVSNSELIKSGELAEKHAVRKAQDWQLQRPLNQWSAIEDRIQEMENLHNAQKNSVALLSSMAALIKAKIALPSIDSIDSFPLQVVENFSLGRYMRLGTDEIVTKCESLASALSKIIGMQRILLVQMQNLNGAIKKNSHAFIDSWQRGRLGEGESHPCVLSYRAKLDASAQPSYIKIGYLMDHFCENVILFEEKSAACKIFTNSEPKPTSPDSRLSFQDRLTSNSNHNDRKHSI